MSIVYNHFFFRVAKCFNNDYDKTAKWLDDIPAKGWGEVEIEVSKLEKEHGINFEIEVPDGLL